VADVVIGELHAHGAPGGRPSKGLERLGRFVLEVRKNDDFRCIFVAHRHI
jgi:hypothetical protein